MLRIVTDGAADMPDGWQDEFEIKILHQGIYFGNEKTPEEFNFKKNDFYQAVKLRREIPKTSFPSIETIKKFYRSISKEGDDILSIHLASGLSGTFSAFQSAAEELKDQYHIVLLDSCSGSAALGFMCREARIYDRAGKTIKDIIERLHYIRRNITIVFTLDSLDFAQFSGRVSKLQSALWSLLKIKPIIMLHNGLLEMVDKVRTRERSLDRILQFVKDRIGDHSINLGVVHAADPGTAQQLMKKAYAWYDIKEAIMTELAIPVAAHLGPGTVGIVAYSIDGE